MLEFRASSNRSSPAARRSPKAATLAFGGVVILGAALLGGGAAEAQGKRKAPAPAASSAAPPPPDLAPAALASASASAAPLAPPSASAPPVQPPPAQPPVQPPAAPPGWGPPPGGALPMSPNELPPGYLPPLGYYPQYPGQPTGGDPFTLPPPIPRERYSTGMMVGGILMVVGGFAGTVAGGVLVSSAKERIDIYCDGPFLCAHKDDDARKTAGGIIMAIGIVTGAAGIPLWIIGSKQIPIKKDAEKKQAALEPRLHVGPASAKLSVQF